MACIATFIHTKPMSVYPPQDTLSRDGLVQHKMQGTLKRRHSGWDDNRLTANDHKFLRRGDGYVGSPDRGIVTSTSREATANGNSLDYDNDNGNSDVVGAQRVRQSQTRFTPSGNKTSHNNDDKVAGPGTATTSNPDANNNTATTSTKTISAASGSKATTSTASGSKATTSTNGATKKPAIFQCEFEGCSYKTTQRRALKRHHIAIHSVDVQWFSCPHCDYQSKRSDHLKRHTAIHLRAKNRSRKIEFRNVRYMARAFTSSSSHGVFTTTVATGSSEERIEPRGEPPRAVGYGSQATHLMRAAPGLPVVNVPQYAAVPGPSGTSYSALSVVQPVIQPLYSTLVNSSQNDAPVKPVHHYPAGTWIDRPEQASGARNNHDVDGDDNVMTIHKCTNKLCQFQCDTYAGLKHHLKTVHAHDAPWWRCIQNCGFECKDFKDLECHMANHHNVTLPPSTVYISYATMPPGQS